jgi:hypothetical protein
MDTQQRLKELQKATSDAIEEYRTRQSQISTARRGPELGNVYLFSVPAAYDVSWVIVAGPGANGLLLVVPADGHPLAGLTDVLVSESTEWGPLTLRCAHSLWIHPSDFRMARWIGTVEKHHVDRAGRKLAQIAAGELAGTAAQSEAEANPDYEDWLTEVERAADALANALRFETEELNIADFSAVVRDQVLEDTDSEIPLELAAASGGELAETSADTGQASHEPVSERRVDFLYPGELSLVMESGGVAIIYRPGAGAAPPPTFIIDPSSQWQPAIWAATPGRSLARAFAAWVDGRVRIRFGEGDSSKEVAVAHP